MSRLTAIAFGAAVATIACQAVCFAAEREDVRTYLSIPHSAAVTAIAPIPGSDVIVSAAEDGLVKVWDPTKGLLVAEFRPQEFAPIGGLAVDPVHHGRIAIVSAGGPLAATSSKGGPATIRVLDWSSGKVLQTFSGQAGQLSYSANARWLTSFAYSLVSIWDLESGRHWATLQVDDGCPTVFADGNTLVYKRNGAMVFLDLTNGTTQKLGIGGRGAFAIAHDGKTLADVGDKEIRIWRRDGTMLASRPVIHSPKNIYFDKTGAVVAGDHFPSIWPGSARNIVYRLKAPDWAVEGFTAGQDPLTMVADGGDSILMGQRNGRIQRVFPESKTLLPELGIRAADATAVAFSVDGSYLAAGLANGGIAVWEPNSNWYRFFNPRNSVWVPPTPSLSSDAKLVRYSQTNIAGEGITNAPEWDAERVAGIAFLRDHALMVVHASGHAEILDVTTGGTLGEFDVSKQSAKVIAVANKRAAIIRQTSVIFVDGRSFDRKTVEFGQLGPVSAAFSEDAGTLIIAGSDRTIEIDATTATVKPIANTRQRWPVRAPDGRLVELRWLGRPLSAEEPIDPRGEFSYLKAAGWTKDLSKVVLALGDGRIRVWNKTERAPIDLRVPGPIAEIAMSPDGQHAAVASSHGRVFVASTANRAGVATLVSYDYRGWLIQAPNVQSFDGSYAAWDLIRGNSTEAPGRTYGAAQLFDEFYEPQLLAAVLASKDNQAHQRERKSASPPAVSILAPEPSYTRKQAGPQGSQLALTGDQRRDAQGKPISVEVFAPSREGSEVAGRLPYTQDRVQLVAETRDRGGGIDECRIFRNRRLIQSVVPDPAAAARAAQFQADLPILEGDNVLSAYCFSKDGTRSNEPEVRVYGSPRAKPSSVAYVIAAGVDKYADKNYKLNFAVADARLAVERLDQILRTTGDYADVIPAVLTDQAATGGALRRALRILAGSEEPQRTGPLSRLRRATPNDAVFFFFAGHGGNVGGEYRLIAVDGAVGTNATKGTVSSFDIRDDLATLQAGRAVIIIDACESGQSLDKIDPRAGPLAGKSLAQLAYDKGMFIISASQSRQAARELQVLGHGLFSHVLFEKAAYAAADRNGDGVISIREWLTFAQDETPKEQERARKENAAKLASASAKSTDAKRSTFADPKLARGQTPRIFLPDPGVATEFAMNTLKK